jgi:hypothetical protein
MVKRYYASFLAGNCFYPFGIFSADFCVPGHLCRGMVYVSAADQAGFGMSNSKVGFRHGLSPCSSTKRSMFFIRMQRTAQAL